MFLSSIISIKMSESDDDTNCPDSVTAQNLVKEFENITNTDEIMGQMYLQVLTIINKNKFIKLHLNEFEKFHFIFGRKTSGIYREL